MIAGSRSTKAYLAERHLDLGRLTLIEMLAQVGALGTMIAYSLWSPSVWALVWGGLFVREERLRALLPLRK